MATTLYINNSNYNNYNISNSVSYTENNYSYTFNIYSLDKEHYYDNINNIIPNPLNNNLVNFNYSSYKYATSDFNGEQNTKYLKRNKSNVSNIIQENFYIPAIGELGISMENIQTINDSICSLGEEYSKYIITDDKIYVSSTLQSNQNIYNKDYQITNNLNNVWNFDTSNAKISYNSISNNYNVLSFLKFDTNVLIDLDMHNDNVVLNSLNNYINYELLIDNKIYYCEYNTPYDIDYEKLKKDINEDDFILDNWIENPFSSKYFYIVNNPECKNIIKNNFYNYYKTIKDENDFIIKNGNVSNINENRIGYISNNGVCTYNSNIKNSYLSSYVYLYYNLPIYNNNMVLVPIYGSGENNYNIKKYYPVCEFYVVVPKLIDFLKINVSDCEVNKKIFLELGSFNMYYIKLSFKTHYPSSNIIEFITKYKTKDYSKKYYFSIYSFNISNILSSDDNLTSYININNFYVNKHSYGWWYSQNDTTGLSNNMINGKFCYSNILSIKNSPIGGHINEKFIELSDLYLEFNKYNSDYFKNNYDLSYLINNISKNFNIGYGTTINRGLRVERIIDQDTYLCNEFGGYDNNLPLYNYNGLLFPCNIQFSSTNNSETIQTINLGINADSDANIKNYPLLEKNWWIFKYSYIDNNHKYKLSYNYHLCNINTYNYYSNSLNKLKKYNISEEQINMLDNDRILFNNVSTYNNSLAYYINYNDLLNYVPVLRLYRTKDEYGINNDLIFAYLYNSISLYKTPFYYNYFIEQNDNLSYNCPIERYCINTNNKIKYLNKFNLNIPIVGTKEALCLNMNLNIDPLRLFRDKENHYYLYSDYLFIYNYSDNSVEVLMDDESLSLVDNKQSVFKIEPGELKVYYPSNFNYNATYREFKNEIYNIKLYNKSSENIKFNVLNIGELNLDIQEAIDNNIYIEDQLGYKYICFLNYLHNKYKNTPNNTNTNIVNIVINNRYKEIISMYESIKKAKEDYLNNKDDYDNRYFNKIQNKFRPSNQIENENISHESEDGIDYYIIQNNINSNNWYYEIPQNSTNYIPISNEYTEEKKLSPLQQRNYSHTNCQIYQGIDIVNIITKHNLDHIINVSESDLMQIYNDYINISIKDYSLNKAGYLIIIKN